MLHPYNCVSHCSPVFIYVWWMWLVFDLHAKLICVFDCLGSISSIHLFHERQVFSAHLEGGQRSPYCSLADGWLANWWISPWKIDGYETIWEWTNSYSMVNNGEFLCWPFEKSFGHPVSLALGRIFWISDPGNLIRSVLGVRGSRKHPRTTIEVFDDTRRVSSEIILSPW